MATEKSWHGSRDDNDGLIPSLGFSRCVRREDNSSLGLTEVGFVPIINSPAHDDDTMWTSILRGLKITYTVNPSQPLVLSVDQPFYAKAHELVWGCGLDQHVVLKMGSFHIVLNFLITIGQHIEGSGLKEICASTGVYADATAEKILQGGGKCHDRAVRAQKLMFQAFFSAYWKEFVAWLVSTDKALSDLQGGIQKLTESLKKR